jgi:hypothetical protein
MNDKFERMSIYDVDFEMTDDKGEKVNYTLKPLPFKYYPKAFAIFSKFSEAKEGDTSNILQLLDEKAVQDLIDLEKVMIQNSYPDLEEKKVEYFVMSNAFELIEPLSKLIFKQSKLQPRQAQANGLPKTN